MGGSESQSCLPWILLFWYTPSPLRGTASRALGAVNFAALLRCARVQRVAQRLSTRGGRANRGEAERRVPSLSAHDRGAADSSRPRWDAGFRRTRMCPPSCVPWGRSQAAAAPSATKPAAAPRKAPSAAGVVPHLLRQTGIAGDGLELLELLRRDPPRAAPVLQVDAQPLGHRVVAGPHGLDEQRAEEAHPRHAQQRHAQRLAKVVAHAGV